MDSGLNSNPGYNNWTWLGNISSPSKTKKPEGASCEISWTNRRRAFPAGHIWQEEAGTPETGRKMEANASQEVTKGGSFSQKIESATEQTATEH